jgi:signal recognition particle receptor subunit beta
MNQASSHSSGRGSERSVASAKQKAQVLKLVVAGLSKEPTPQEQFDFISQQAMMSKLRAAGYIILVDSTKPQNFGQFLSILYTVRGYHAEIPLVVAATKQDHPKAWSVQDIQLGLGIRDVTVLPCITSNHPTVRDVVVDLLYKAMG